MSRLSATLRLDSRLQSRNKVYWIVAAAAFGLAFALRGLFSPDQLRFFMPLVALAGVSLTAFFLIAVLLLLEREEGTLSVVLVSPLRPVEYLGSKLLTVTALAVAESAVVVGVAYGLDFSPSWLVAAVVLRAALVAAAGVAVAVRCRSITHFLFPAVVLTVAFDLPVLWYLDLWPASLFYLWPTLPSLLLAKAAFMPVDLPALAYACSYGAVAVGAFCVWALRSLDRFVVRGDSDT